jgi:hypothetical protein
VLSKLAVVVFKTTWYVKWIPMAFAIILITKAANAVIVLDQ